MSTCHGLGNAATTDSRKAGKAQDGALEELGAAQIFEEAKQATQCGATHIEALES